jgi:hypothetical protein
MEPMKTTLDLNDTLLASAKSLAARQRSSLTRLIEEGLELRLRAGSRSARAGKKGVPRLPVFPAGGKRKRGLVAGVDPASNKAMRDAMDEDGPR